MNEIQEKYNRRQSIEVEEKHAEAIEKRKKEKHTKATSLSKLYCRNYKDIELNGIWKEVLGVPELGGLWLIWGNEKNGKTWLSLMLAEQLSLSYKVLYISAEEGLSKSFQEACKRAKLEAGNRKLLFYEYMNYEELVNKLSRRRSAEVIFIDNITVYQEELKYGKLRELLRLYPNKLFVILAHAEGNQLYTSTAKMAGRLAVAVIRVEGMKCSVTGRVPGGVLVIDEQKSKVYWGDERVMSYEL
jgi:hypothetical protein